jgi:hypothetical protein
MDLDALSCVERVEVAWRYSWVRLSLASVSVATENAQVAAHVSGRCDPIYVS